MERVGLAALLEISTQVEQRVVHLLAVPAAEAVAAPAARQPQVLVQVAALAHLESSRHMEQAETVGTVAPRLARRISAPRQLTVLVGLEELARRRGQALLESVQSVAKVRLVL